MTLKEFLEIMASILTITVSITVLYGAFMGVKKKIFHRVHDIIKAVEEKLHIEK
ncbi:MAG: hypothetical protein LBL61_01295 [Elusimicrobiota bacterium]|jgi:hypothetical protein|nr:hypothetical protein [Elusimicrobiota bacterium]